MKRAIAGLIVAALAMGGGCGSDDEATLTPVEVTRLEANLEAVDQALAVRDREAAFAAFRQLRSEAEELDESDDASARLREAFLTGIARLKESLAKELPK